MKTIHVIISLAVLAGSVGCGRVPESDDVRPVSFTELELPAATSTPRHAATVTLMPGCGGHPGAPMVQVASLEGRQYCIDTTEVTQAQYAEFLSENDSTPGAENERCLHNRTFAPTQNVSYPHEPANCPAELWSPKNKPDTPVVCVDWCDAVAYCHWAGKRLCGFAEQPDDVTTDRDDANKSEWFNACTNGGVSQFPYGDIHDPVACLGAERTRAAYQVATDAISPASGRPRCKGDRPPFSSIFDLSGSVREWTDECKWVATPRGGSWWCALRGGDYLSRDDDMACNARGKRGVGTTSAHIGFRCCADPVPKEARQ
jgi:formylglycine-generating enzyme required for sulfatase activity